MPLANSAFTSRPKPLRIIVVSVLLLSSGLLPFLAPKCRANTVENSRSATQIRGIEAGNAISAIGGAAKQVGQDSRHLLERAPMEWNAGTIRFIIDRFAALPAQMPGLLRFIAEESFSLTLLSSVILIVMVGSVLYRLVARKRLLRWVQEEALAILGRIPATLVPYIFFLFKVAAASLVPLLLLGTVSLAGELVVVSERWFRLVTGLLSLWAIGSVGINMLGGLLTGEVLSVCPRYGKELFGLLRLFLVYVLAVVGLSMAAKAIQIRGDVLAFVQFVIRMSVVFAAFFLLLGRKALLSVLLPDLPYKGYQAFTRFLDRSYRTLIILSGAVGFLWCLGFNSFAGAFFKKTWAVAGTYVGVVAMYHFLQNGLGRWSESKARDEAALYFYRAARSLLRYAALVTGALVILHLFGFLDPLRQIMSFPIYTIGTTPVSIWILVEAVLVLLFFIYVSRLLQTYLDYKFYPTLGIETGLAYAMNTILKYLFILLGVLFSLRFVGFDLQVLLLFAGTAGIGIGFGLKDFFASMVSGFGIIFGRKVRKGDWIKVGDTVGTVSDIYLYSTKINTRDNIEYIIPNSEFTSKIIVNYSLSSPMIRVHIPVGVSYSADPQKVKKLLLECAERQPYVSHHEKPQVWFSEFADSSINFELLVWADVRTISERDIRSRLYFSIFKALQDAGIEIPFPHRDIHIIA